MSPLCYTMADHAIFERLKDRHIRNAMLRGDTRDACIMDSIEARRENVWRVQGVKLSVSDLCAYAAHELAMLEFATKEQ